MFNVQSKTDSKVTSQFSQLQPAVLHESNKEVNGKKTKKKTIEQSGVRKGSPMEGVGWIRGLLREGFKEKVSFDLQWKRVGVKDNKT